jgi:type II secretory pathway component PulF
VADSPSASSGAITLDELIALNDEICALVRAEVPLDKGLSRVASDLSGRQGNIAARLGDGLSQGQDLAEALQTAGVSFPPIYRAVVEAGIRSGRLSSALETVAQSTRRLAGARRTVVASMIYPLFVFLLAWGLFVFFVQKIAGGLLYVFEGTNTWANVVLENVASLRETLPYWGWTVPLAALLFFTCWAYRSSKASLLQPESASLLFGWLPWLGAMVRAFRNAAFAETLQILVAHDVPLPQAIRLAADAACTKKMRAGAEQIAGAIERGERLGGAVDHAPGFTPVLEWLLRSGHDTGTLQSALKHAADVYQRRAQRLANTAQLYMPPLLTFAIGGSVTMAYAALTFGTWIAILRSVSTW